MAPPWSIEDVDSDTSPFFSVKVFRFNVALEATSKKRKSASLELVLRWIVWPLPTMVRLSPDVVNGSPLGPSLVLSAVVSKSVMLAPSVIVLEPPAALAALMSA
jgi:hypothetical protein